MIRMWREESVQYEESVEDINSDAAKVTMRISLRLPHSGVRQGDFGLKPGGEI
jgi:hypothetical protein